MMYRVMIFYEVSLLYYQMTKNSVVNRNLASVIITEMIPLNLLRTNKVICIFARSSEL